MKRNASSVLTNLVGGCQFQATENATKSQNTTLKTYGELSYINIWDQKVQDSVSLESGRVRALRNTVNVWDQMSRVTS